MQRFLGHFSSVFWGVWKCILGCISGFEGFCILYRDRIIIIQKNPRVRKIRVRNSGAGNGCSNFMGAWKNAFFLQENLCP